MRVAHLCRLEMLIAGCWRKAPQADTLREEDLHGVDSQLHTLLESELIDRFLLRTRETIEIDSAPIEAVVGRAISAFMTICGPIDPWRRQTSPFRSSNGYWPGGRSRNARPGLQTSGVFPKAWAGQRDFAI